MESDKHKNPMKINRGLCISADPLVADAACANCRQQRDDLIVYSAGKVLSFSIRYLSFFVV